jgi:hypothetical protein
VASYKTTHINPADYTVAPVGLRQAKTFIEANHYTGTFPVCVETVGLWEGGRLVGVAALSIPPSVHVIPKWLQLPNPDPRSISAVVAAKQAGTLAIQSEKDNTDRSPAEYALSVARAAINARDTVAQREKAAIHGLDLGRLVLLDDIAGNAESWFLSRVFKYLARNRPGCAGVMATSDPLCRVNDGGDIVCPGHVGTIYQATNGQYVGRTKARYIYLDTYGRTVSARVFSKAAAGWADRYATEQVTRIAGPIQCGETVTEWIHRAQNLLTRVYHPGAFVYRWPIGRYKLSDMDSLPYPKETEIVTLPVEAARGCTSGPVPVATPKPPAPRAAWTWQAGEWVRV